MLSDFESLPAAKIRVNNSNSLKEIMDRRGIAPFLIALMAIIGPLNAAEIRLIEGHRADMKHGGSLDGGPSTGIGNNLKDDDEIICNISLEGRIDQGDLEKLKSTVDAADDPWIKIGTMRLCLNSPGGSFDEALKIFEFMLGKSISTAVLPNRICVSACAIIFMAGRPGTWWGLSRFIHPSSTLAFHAPYLQGVPPGLDPKEFLAAAYAKGIQAVQKLMKIAQRGPKGVFRSELTVEMLAKGPGEADVIDTVEKLARFRIGLFDGAPPRLNALAFCNACTNFYDTDPEIDDCPNISKDKNGERLPHGVRYKFLVGGTNGTMCHVDVARDGQKVSGWYVSDHEPSEGEFGTVLAYWYLYAPHTPIKSLARSVRHR
jgi:ATP-dependent protease ClpP protease subunit